MARRRRRPVAALAALAAGAILVGCGSDPPRLQIGAGPASYRIEYRVEGQSVSTETVTVVRPFASSVVTAGSVRTTDLGRIALGEQVLAHPPNGTTADVRVSAVLDDAEAAGLLERREIREILGRRCQVLRSGRPLREGPLQPPTARTYSDACVDESGLVLEEVLVTDGERDLRRVAVAVELDVELDTAGLAERDTTVPADQGGGAVRPVRADDDLPPPELVLRPPPAGFRSLGHYLVVPPRGQDPFLGGEGRAATAEVFVRGIDVVVVEQGGTLLGTAAFPEPAGNRAAVDLGEIGEGEAVLSAQVNEVRRDLGGGRFVRISGTLPIADLAAIARSLTTP